jgi:hypothetical protein
MSIFSIIKEAVGNEPKSFGWYRDNVKVLFKMSDLYADLVEQEETLNPIPGQLYMFEYKAIYAERLNFYDRFPLVYITGGGDPFRGINLHYLALRPRLNLVLNLENGVIAGVPKRAYHNYLTRGLETPLYLINSDDYRTAAFLPVEDFGGTSRTAVWNGAKQS